jgi:hypothetical protein
LASDQELSEICPRLPKYQNTDFPPGFSRLSACEANIQEHQLHALKQGGKMTRKTITVKKETDKPMSKPTKTITGSKPVKRVEPSMCNDGKPCQ